VTCSVDLLKRLIGASAVRPTNSTRITASTMPAPTGIAKVSEPPS
jgi:hypothetical protein